jgi:hypothetical protein
MLSPEMLTTGGPFLRPLGPRRSALRTHLYIVAIALLAAASVAPQPAREPLNSERIAAAFGNYGIDVLEQDEQVRVSNLFSTSAAGKTCRTFAVVRFPEQIDPAVAAEHAAIVAGGSIGEVFTAHGWAVRKTHLSYAVRPAPARLASLMRVEVGTPLAEHSYVLDVVKDGRTIEYAALVEIHHPEYLVSDDLPEIYGPVGAARPQLVAQLRATVEEHTR